MSRSRGFSLIELLIALVIAGIVLLISMPGFQRYRSTMALQQARAQLMEDVRGARQLAVTRRSNVVVRFGTPPTTTNITSYTIFLDTNGNGALDAGESGRVVRMPRTTRLSNVALSPTDLLEFDISGILLPGTSGGTLSFVNDLNRADTLMVSAAGIAYRP